MENNRPVEKKRRGGWILPGLLFLILLLLAAILVRLSLERPSAAQTGAGSDFPAARIDAVSQLVLDREVVPEDYLRWLDEETAQAVERYNDGTVRWTQYFANYAHSVAEGLFYEHKESPGDYDQPMLYYEWIGRISHLALYRNADELLLTDPYLVWPLAKESGGSYGLWASRIHAQSSLGDETYGELMAYLDETDALLDALDEARQG